jgi:hypothetical protein
MPKAFSLRRAARGGISTAVLFAGVIALPSIAGAAAIDLGTAQSFVVLAGSTATNSNTSVLNGELGVAPGNALTGFGAPSLITGATHAGDAAAADGQLDAQTAYGVAFSEPYSPGDDLTGTDLGNRTLLPGTYHYSTSAQLTGPLTLDAQGDRAARFVIQIGTTLTTASASSVVLVGNASACNIFWQVGSSATLGTGTAFAGNVLALTSITATTGASVLGRLLAANGAVTLDNNTLTLPNCPPINTPVVGTAAPTTGTATADDAAGTPGSAVIPAPAGSATTGGGNSGGEPAAAGTPSLVQRAPANCARGFRGSVRGRGIASVVFRIGSRVIGTQTRAPFQVYVRASPGRHLIRARVSFADGRRAQTVSHRYVACAAALLTPAFGPSVFTG